jgi:CBS domain-containing protein
MSVTDLGGLWLETRRRLDSDTPVSRLMTTSAEADGFELDIPGRPSVHALATVREAAHLMASRGLHQIHVKNTRGEIVGVLTTTDLYRWVTDQGYDDTEGHA